MHVTIRLFAAQREAAGVSSFETSVPDGSTIEQIYARACEQMPALAATKSSVAFARNRTHALRSEVAADGDEIAVLPPVAGG